MKKVLILAACAFLLCCCTDSDSSSVDPSTDLSADSSAGAGAKSAADKSDDSEFASEGDSAYVYVNDPEDWKIDAYSGRVAVVDSVDQLSNCNAKTAGDTVLIKSIKKVYYCDSDNWEYFGKASAHPKSSSSQSSSSAKSSSSVRTSCPKNLAADEICDKRDFQVYRTTRIGALKWMAQNLNYFVEGSICYDNQDSNCIKYGRLYNWPEAMDFDEGYRVNSAQKLIKKPYHQGICPAGWHVPDTLEWKYLVDYVGGETNLMGKGWKEDHPDAYGFSAIPTGFYNSYFFNFWEGCAPLECRVDFISATEDSTADYYIDRNIDTFFDSTFIPTQVNFYQVHINDNKGMNLAADSKSHKFSVRCVQDSLYEEMAFREPSSSAERYTPVESSSSEMHWLPLSSSAESSSSVTVRCKDWRNYSGFAWLGEDGQYRIWTEYDNGTESSGYWYQFNDGPDGGESSIDWPASLVTEYDDEAFDNVIDYCAGMCGTYHLRKGTLSYPPYVGFAFNVAGVSDQTFREGRFYTPAQPADVTDWFGLCVSYSTDADSTFLELSMGDTLDAAAGYILPRVHLPKTKEPREFCAQWTSFKSPATREEVDGGVRIVTGPEAATMLATVRFVVSGGDGGTGEFKLARIGGYCW